MPRLAGGCFVTSPRVLFLCQRQLLPRRERTTHVDRVQNVNLNQSVAQRILGIGDIEWDTAGTDAPDANFTFHGVDDPSALVRAADRFYGEGVRETAGSSPSAPPVP